MSIKQAIKWIVFLLLISFTAYTINQSIWFISYSPLPQCPIADQTVQQSINRLIPHEIEVSTTYGYKLYEFVDASINHSINASKPSIVFVHGHRGSYNQGRSLVVDDSNHEFRWFAVDFDSNSWSAFHGQILIHQSDYLVDCLYTIHQLINPQSLSDADENQIILVGHSMGGIAARLAANRLIDQQSFNINQSVVQQSVSMNQFPIPLIVTINTPHRSLPFYVHSSVHRLVEQLHHQSTNDQSIVLSISGGHGDHQIRADLTSILSVDQPIKRSITLDYSGTINCITSHDSILNNRQLTEAINQSISRTFRSFAYQRLNATTDWSPSQALYDSLTEQWLFDRKQLIQIAASDGSSYQSLDDHTMDSSLPIDQKMNQSISQSIAVSSTKTHFHMTSESVIFRPVNQSTDQSVNHSARCFIAIWLDIPSSQLAASQLSADNATYRSVKAIALNAYSTLFIIPAASHIIVKRLTGRTSVAPTYVSNQTTGHSTRGVAQLISIRPLDHSSQTTVRQAIDQLITPLTTLPLNLYPIKVSLHHSNTLGDQPNHLIDYSNQSDGQNIDEADRIILFHSVVPSLESFTLSMTSPFTIAVDPIHPPIHRLFAHRTHESIEKSNVHLSDQPDEQPNGRSVDPLMAHASDQSVDQFIFPSHDQPYVAAMVVDTRQSDEQVFVLVEPTSPIDRLVDRLIDHLPLLIPMLCMWLMTLQLIIRLADQSYHRFMDGPAVSFVSWLPVLLMYVVLFSCVSTGLNYTFNMSPNQSFDPMLRPTLVEWISLMSMSLVIAVVVVGISDSSIECSTPLFSYVRKLIKPSSNQQRSAVQPLSQVLQELQLFPLASSNYQSIHRVMNRLICRVPCPSVAPHFLFCQQLNHSLNRFSRACLIILFILSLMDPIVSLAVTSTIAVVVRMIDYMQSINRSRQPSDNNDILSSIGSQNQQVKLPVGRSVTTAFIHILIFVFLIPWLLLSFIDRSISRSIYQTINRSTGQSGASFWKHDCLVLLVCVIFVWTQSTWLAVRLSQSIHNSSNQTTYQLVNQSDNQSDDNVELHVEQSDNHTDNQSALSSDVPNESVIDRLFWLQFCVLMIISLFLMSSIDLDSCAMIMMINQLVDQLIEIRRLIKPSTVQTFQAADSPYTNV